MIATVDLLPTYPLRDSEGGQREGRRGRSPGLVRHQKVPRHVNGERDHHALQWKSYTWRISSQALALGLPVVELYAPRLELYQIGSPGYSVKDACLESHERRQVFDPALRSRPRRSIHHDRDLLPCMPSLLVELVSWGEATLLSVTRTFIQAWTIYVYRCW